MDKNEPVQPNKKRKKNPNRSTAILSMVMFAALLIVDLYVMINRPGNHLALVVITLLALICIYFFIDAILIEIHKTGRSTENQYENILKSEKASYLLLKRAFEQMDRLEQSKSKEKEVETGSLEEVINAQKALAKVTINRSRENADAIMNSNDKVLEKIYDLEEKIGSSQVDQIDSQNNILEESVRELIEKQQHLIAEINAIKQMETSLKDELVQSINNIQIQIPEPVVREVYKEETSAVSDELPDLSGMDLGESESLLDEMPDLSGMDLGESESLLDEMPDLSGMDLGESESLLDELPDLSGMDLGESESLLDEMPSLGEMDLNLMMDEPEPMPELEPEPMPEPEPEPVQKKESFTPDPSNSNKLMTPEEIAALIANL